MAIEIVINAKNAEEARREMRDLLGGDAPIATAQTPEPAAPPEARVADKPAGGKRPLPPTKKTVEFAEENNVDLSTEQVEGTGKDGRITKADVERYIESRPAGEPNTEDEQGESEDEAPAGEPEPEPEPESATGVEIPDPDEGEPTLEQAREALMKLNDATNLKTAQDMVKKHGAGKIQDVDPTKYRAFINDCNQAIREAKGE